MKITLIPVSERSKWACHVCGTDKSVKYRVTSNGATFAVCNKCAALYYTEPPKK